MTDCALDHTTPEPVDIGLLCGDHFTHLRGRLIALPAVAGWLQVNLAAGGAPGERVSGSREDPIPLRQDVLDLIGPDSTRYVAGTTPVGFLLWEDGLIVGEFGTWQAAQTAFAAEMADARVDVQVIDLLTRPHTAEELRELFNDDPELVERLEVARTRWQVRPTSRGGGDQAGVDAIRAQLRYWAKIVHDDGGFPYPVASVVMFDGQVIGEYAEPRDADEDCRRSQWQRRRYDDPKRWTVGIAAARDGWSVYADVRWLTDYISGHLSWIAGQPWVAEFLADVAVAHSTAHRLVPWRAETRRDQDPCPQCKAKAVVLHIAAGESRCEKKAGGCGRRQPLSEYVLNAVLPESRRSA